MPRPKLQETSTLENSKPIAFFIIGCGGHTESEYFKKLVIEREDVKVETLPPLKPSESRTEQNLSSPLQTVERVDDFWKKWDKEAGDKVWIVLDVDHHFTGGHLSGTNEALELANSQDYRVVFSNPCFEVWLVLHREEMLPTSTWPDCDSLVKHIGVKWGRNKKTKLHIEDYRPHIRDAIGRARRLRGQSSLLPPPNPGTDVDYLMDALDEACGETKVF